ncbi:MAG: photosystem I reaction center subunit XII [Leptolyngbyaceae cyanobacterium SU_3_3]|nr:photosystem I reaction center subunit XII [Leptolyngbyaceae cyanobacterium SU_3_3]
MALWIDTESIELRLNATEEDLQAVIRAVYRQVLGNAHVMDSQRLTSAESQLRNGDITVRGFVRAVAQSDLYRSLCFEASSPYRFIELNFKHLLGRAPQDQTEISEHVQRYNTQGYATEINSYIDSDEYFLNFGENGVPFTRGNQTQTGIKNVGFNRTFALNRGFAANDVGKSAKLIGDLGSNLPTKIVTPSVGSGAYSNTGKRFRIVASKSNAGPRVTQGTTTFEVQYSQLSRQIQSIHRTGGKILSLTEVA